MANLRISQLTPGNPAQSGDVIPIERSDVNFSITAGSIAALAPGGTVTSVGFEGDGTVLSSTESGPVTGSGILSATLNTQSANLILAGPTTGSAATPTFRSLVLADLPSIPWSSLANPTGNLSLSMGTDTTTFNQTSNTVWLWANTTTATGSTTNASPLLELAANYYTGSASAADTWTIGSSLAAGTNGASTLTFTHSGSTGSAAVRVPLLDIGGTDAGISRLGAASLAIGNGTAGDYSGSLKLNNLTVTGTGLTVLTSASGGIGPGSGGNALVLWASSTPIALLNSSTGSGVIIWGTLGFSWASGNPTNTSPDTGFFRLGAASVALGNGTVGDTTGNLSFNKVIKYAGVATVSAGVPSELATVDLTAQSAAIAATTLYAVPAAGAGMYRITWVATITTKDAASSALGGTNGFQISFTSPTDSVVKTDSPTTPIISAANTTGTSISGCEVVYAKASTNIQYAFGYTSTTPGQMVFELHIKCEAM